MTDLPDCTCGGPVRLEVDHEGAAEVCVKCGTAYWPQPPVGWRQEIRRRVRVVAELSKDEQRQLRRPGLSVDTVNTGSVL